MGWVVRIGGLRVREDGMRISGVMKKQIEKGEEAIGRR